MFAQETVSGTTGSLTGKLIATFVIAAAAAALVVGPEQLLNMLDTAFSSRQLAFNRNLNGVLLSCKFFLVIIASFVIARLFAEQGRD